MRESYCSKILMVLLSMALFLEATPPLIASNQLAPMSFKDVELRNGLDLAKSIVAKVREIKYGKKISEEKFFRDGITLKGKAWYILSKVALLGLYLSPLYFVLVIKHSFFFYNHFALFFWTS